MAHGSLVPSSYDARLVALSVLVATVAAYVALTFGERVAKKQGRTQVRWLAGGATVMGCGIWSMHFTGMLALRLGIPVQYDIGIVALSLVAAIFASGIALFVVSRQTMGPGAWLVGGLLMGSGIVAMHYTGMAAMRLPAVMRWDWNIVVLSYGIAVAVSLIALAFVFQLRALPKRRYEWRGIAAAIIMGAAVAGMHYTGMAAAIFTPSGIAQSSRFAVSAAALSGGGIAIITILVLVLTLAGAHVERRFAEQSQALVEGRHHRMIVASAPVILLALDVDGTITMAEGRLAKLHLRAQALADHPLADVFRDIPSLLLQARRALAGEEFTAHATIQKVVLEMRWTPVHDELGVLAGVIAVGTDITERRRADMELRYQALYDELTDLPNRAYLNRRLAQALQAAHDTGASPSLALLDLNRFKEINDTLGHVAGDALLQQVAARLRGVLREDEFVARIGGDEFAVLQTDATENDARGLAGRISGALAGACIVEGHAISVEGSVGLALYPDHGEDASTLLRHADVAMYVAKRAGLACAVYDALQDRHSTERLMLENGLRKAIAANELVLHYQPKIDVVSGRLLNVEALVRWQHPALGLLAPDQFIPLAEETGLILPVTHWVLEIALRAVHLLEQSGTSIGVAVNLSMRTLHDPALFEIIEHLLERYSIAPSRLTVEITESALTVNPELTRIGIVRLAALGVVLSIDDFGTGYSNLSYLKELPINEIKIDKSFVLGMGVGQKDAAIVRWLIQLGHELEIRVVAEGVETVEAWSALQMLGCDVAQGYFVSRPLPADALERWIASSSWGRRTHGRSLRLGDSCSALEGDLLHERPA